MTEINTERIAHEYGVDETIVTAVVNRLQLVRGNLTESGFHSLVRDVVRTKVSFAERDAREDLSVVRIRHRAD